MLTSPASIYPSNNQTQISTPYLPLLPPPLPLSPVFPPPSPSSPLPSIYPVPSIVQHNTYTQTIIQNLLLPKAGAIVASPAILGEVISVLTSVAYVEVLITVLKPHDPSHQRSGKGSTHIQTQMWACICMSLFLFFFERGRGRGGGRRRPASTFLQSIIFYKLTLNKWVDGPPGLDTCARRLYVHLSHCIKCPLHKSVYHHCWS